MKLFKSKKKLIQVDLIEKFLNIIYSILEIF